jgi:glycine hydroxymethyltransferase
MTVTDAQTDTAADPELDDLLAAEASRQRGSLNLLAGENFATQGTLRALASPLGNKYAEGYPGRRHHTGCALADAVETLAVGRATALFHADHANVQPYSGTMAMLAVCAALLRPRESLLAMSLQHGGHLSHGSHANFSGAWFEAQSYGVREEDGLLDIEQVRRLARTHRPKVIVAGAISYPRAIDWAAFREVADDVGAYLVADAAQVTGLIAGGALESPVPYADVVVGATHKTLRGPRGGLILCTRELAERVDRAVFPFIQGGPSMHEVAAKAAALHEAAQPGFRAYAARCVANARALARELAARGVRPLTGGSDTHLVTGDLRGLGLTGREAERRCERAGILVGRCAVPYDPAPLAAASGVRLGTGCLTTQGIGEAELPRVADLLLRALADADGAAAETLADEVRELVAAFPPYHPSGGVG